MATRSFNHPYREIQDIPEDRELLSPNSAYSLNSIASSQKLRRTSIETVYHVPEKLDVPRITERWEQAHMKMISSPTQRYEVVAQAGLSDLYARMRKGYRMSLLAGLALNVLGTILASLTAALSGSGMLQSPLIWVAALGGISLVNLGVLIFLARLKRGLGRQALICHLFANLLVGLLWFATAAVLIVSAVHAKQDSYKSAVNGLVPAVGGLGVVVGLIFCWIVFRVTILLRHASI